MAKRTYINNSDSPFKQIWLSESLFTDSCVTESDYMALSPKWRSLREARLKFDHYSCVKCGAAYPLSVHHLRYPPVWGMERLEDLETLCDVCHKKIHGIREEK